MSVISPLLSRRLDVQHGQAHSDLLEQVAW